jgi:hypothetical protein
LWELEIGFVFLTPPTGIIVIILYITKVYIHFGGREIGFVLQDRALSRGLLVQDLERSASDFQPAPGNWLCFFKTDCWLQRAHGARGIGFVFSNDSP